MDREPHAIRHDRQVREDAMGTKQHVPLTRHEFHWTERFRERLQRSIELDNFRPSIP
jgi:hypothetical protein